MQELPFMKNWHDEARRRGTTLTEHELKVIRGHMSERSNPERGIDFLLDLRPPTKRGRVAACADIAEPEWWPFYFEQAVRNIWRDAPAIRATLGLDGPLAGVPELEAFVSRVIEETDMPSVGQAISLECSEARWPYERLAFTLHTNANPAALEAMRLIPSNLIAALTMDLPSIAYRHLKGSPYAARYAALVFVAGLGLAEVFSPSLGLSAAEVTQYILCDIMPERPEWMGWTRTGGHYDAGVTLHVPTLAITPEQVRTLYTQARDAIAGAAQYYPEGCPIPQSVGEDRMKAVRFVEEHSKRGELPDWRTLWELAGGEETGYSTPDSFKAAYHAAVEPVRYLKPKQAKGGESE